MAYVHICCEQCANIASSDDKVFISSIEDLMRIINSNYLTLFDDVESNCLECKNIFILIKDALDGFKNLISRQRKWRSDKRHYVINRTYMVEYGAFELYAESETGISAYVYDDNYSEIYTSVSEKEFFEVIKTGTILFSAFKDEFFYSIKKELKHRGIKMILIDSDNTYILNKPPMTKPAKR